jgi:hypothetical protein
MSTCLVHLGQNHAETEVHLDAMCLHSTTNELTLLISITKDHKSISQYQKGNKTERMCSDRL